MSETYVNANFHLKNNWLRVYQRYSEYALCNNDIKIFIICILIILLKMNMTSMAMIQFDTQITMIYNIHS